MTTKEELLRLASAMNGLSILGCLPDSPAHRAGLRYGDVVLEVNGVPTPDWVAYLRAVNTRSRQMTVRYLRGGEEHFVVLELDAEREVVEPQDLLASVASRVLSKLQSENAMPENEPEPLLN